MRGERKQYFPLSTINTGLTETKPTDKPENEPQLALIISNENKNSDKPLSFKYKIWPNHHLHELESIKDTISTGYGNNNTVIKECPKINLVTHLSKENYLSEFGSETEKQLVRNNLNIYSRQEVVNLVNKSIIDLNTTFVSLEYLDDKIDKLNFVDSTLKSWVNYQIPETLFKL